LAVKDTGSIQDNDVVGVMLKFNPVGDTNNYSGYLLLLDNGGYSNSIHNGLWRGNNIEFSMQGSIPWNESDGNATRLTTRTDVRWSNKLQHYRIEAIGNKITVYRWNNADGNYNKTSAEKLFEYTDNSNDAIMYGTFGLWALSQSGVQFRNIVAITSINDDYTIS
jgi:hypothetical protein